MVFPGFGGFGLEDHVPEEEKALVGLSTVTSAGTAVHCSGVSAFKYPPDSRVFDGLSVQLSLGSSGC